MTAKSFQSKCEKVSEQLGIAVEFYLEGTGRYKRSAGAFEDDGSLHVTRSGLRAAFDVGEGQSLSGKAQNKNTRAVMEALDVPVTDRVLVDEKDNEDGDDER